MRYFIYLNGFGILRIRNTRNVERRGRLEKLNEPIQSHSEVVVEIEKKHFLSFRNLLALCIYVRRVTPLGQCIHYTSMSMGAYSLTAGAALWLQFTYRNSRMRPYQYKIRHIKNDFVFFLFLLFSFSM